MLNISDQSSLGRLAVSGAITQREYEAGRRWHNIYSQYLRCIGAPAPHGSAEMPGDEECELWTALFRRGRQILEAKGKRVFHAVNAIAVYEEPEEYGDREFRVAAAKVGLATLADSAL